MQAATFTPHESALETATGRGDYAEAHPDDSAESAIIIRSLTEVDDVSTALALSPGERADRAAWGVDDVLASYEGDSEIAKILSPAIWALVELAKRRSSRGISVYEREAQRHA